MGQPEQKETELKYWKRFAFDEDRRDTPGAPIAYGEAISPMSIPLAAG